MGVLGRVSVATASLGLLGVGLGVGTAPAVAAPPAPNGLTPMVVQLQAVERFAPTAFVSTIAWYLSELRASGSLNTDDLNAELNGISQGLQMWEQMNQGNPHNGLVGTVVNELNDYITAHGGTPGPTPGGGCGGGTPA